jgi:predicted alpha/beta hydrolase family esterase
MTMGRREQLLFVQGGGQGTHDEWDDKLVESLRRQLGPDYEINYPRMPREEEPSYARWKPALEKALGTLRDGAALVAHSVGGTTLIKLLSESSPQKFSAIFFVAVPFIGDGGWQADDVQPPPGLAARLPKGIPIHFFHGLNDEVAPPSHLDLYARELPEARVHRLPGRDHQLNNDLSEVAAEILRIETR